MSRRFALPLLFVFASLAAPVARGGLILDRFTESQTVQVLGDPKGTRSTFAQAADPGALGGARGVWVERTTRTGTVTVDVGDGVLSFDSGARVAGQAEIRYDGAGPSGTFDPTGLGHLDLTDREAKGFHLQAASDLGARLVLTVFSDAGRASEAIVDIAADPTFAFRDYVIPFLLFQPKAGFGAADFGSVGALSLLIDGRSTAGTDVALGLLEVTAVPEPSTLVIAGTGALLLPILATARRRKAARARPTLNG